MTATVTFVVSRVGGSQPILFYLDNSFNSEFKLATPHTFLSCLPYRNKRENHSVLVLTLWSNLFFNILTAIV
jgi:hypothetical protein